MLRVLAVNSLIAGDFGGFRLSGRWDCSERLWARDPEAGALFIPSIGDSFGSCELECDFEGVQILLFRL